MNARLSISLILLVLALSAALPAQPAREERTQTRITELLGHRLAPTPLPSPLPNPFASLTRDPTAPSSVSDEATTLARYAAELKISGSALLAGRPHLMINSAAFKEGDLIKVSDDPVTHLRIVQILPNELTLGYGSATLTIPIRMN
ncbi:MAG: hypothetical protein Q8J74_15030 [Candidatus Didemnitutus sp.]|nr:hypothetical protein [Candidatus Didemnitutus sp.]